jgi:FkbM family methyltransferase
MSMDEFGVYAPSVWSRRLIAAIRHSPLRRGHGRDLAASLLRATGQDDVDIVFHGARLRLSLAANAAAQFALIFEPSREAEELQFLQEGSAGGTFVDIGAHVGAYSLPVSMSAHRVIAIEPNPAILDRLRFNCSASNACNVTIVPEAVSDRAGVVTFMSDDGNLGGSRVSADGRDGVPARPLLDILGETGVDDISALKIDIEGHERQALAPFFRSAPETLWPKRIVIEHTHADLQSTLAAHGYDLVSKTRKNLMLQRG